MQCAHCRADVQDGDRFCGQCGIAQPHRCTTCGSPNAPGARFCSQCGTRQASAPTPVVSPAAAEAPAQPSPERRHLTVMFCDLVGSTALASRLDPEDFHRIVNVYYQIVETEVKRFGGYVARHVGDGVLVYFGYPIAHEDDSERAVRAGLAIVAQVGGLDRADDETCQVRIGIATGLVVVDVIGYGAGSERTVSGSTPNLAARLQAAAEPGTILVAPSTYDLVSTVFDFRDHGEHLFKGLDPVLVREVVRPKSREDRRTAMFARSIPLVGRSDEVGLLMRRWMRAAAGEGSAALISGDPGIGKSRIIQALADRIGMHATGTIYFHGSAHHEDSALFPVIASLGHAAGLYPEDEPETRLHKAEPFFARIEDLEPAERLVLVALVTGEATHSQLDRSLTPRNRMERTIKALVAYVVALARREPLLMIVEDAHWIDPSSREFVRQLVEVIGGLPILLIVTARPSYQPDWLGLAQATILQINRLNRREGATLVMQVMGEEHLPADLLDEMIDRADGVPLFLEELTKAVIEGTRRSGAPEVVSSVHPRATIPSTLQASLTARLDRLSVARELAQEAASIGREFALDLIAAVTDRAEEDLASALEQLEMAGLLLRRGLPPRTSYYFKHALMQDAAYETLTRSKREALHRRIAEVYEGQFQDLIQSRPEILAHHLQHANLEQKAIEAWSQAAARTMERGAMPEAVAQLKRGLALIERLPDPMLRSRLELKLQVPLGNALMAARGYAEAETTAAFQRARALCQQIGESDQLMRIAWGQFTSFFAGGRLADALAEAEELLVLAHQRDDLAGLQVGHASAGAALLHLGRLPEALVQLQQALDLLVTDQKATALLYGQSGRITALAYLGLARSLQNNAAEAAELGRRSIREARAIGHSTTLCFAQSVGCRSAFLRRDAGELATLAVQVARVAEDQGLKLWAALGAVYRGWTQAQIGQRAEAMLLIRQGLSAYRAIGSGLSVGLYIATLATLESERRQHDVALVLLDEAHQASQEASEQWIQPEILRRRGDALAAAGRMQEAEDALQSGLALARRDGFALWEAYLDESLARLQDPKR